MPSRCNFGLETPGRSYVETQIYITRRRSASWLDAIHVIFHGLKLDQSQCLIITTRELIDSDTHHWHAISDTITSSTSIRDQAIKLDQVYQELFQSDKYHSNHNDTPKMNLHAEFQYSPASIIGFMLSGIFYGKHRPTTAFGPDTDL